MQCVQFQNTPGSQTSQVLLFLRVNPKRYIIEFLIDRTTSQPSFESLTFKIFHLDSCTYDFPVKFIIMKVTNRDTVSLVSTIFRGSGQSLGRAAHANARMNTRILATSSLPRSVITETVIISHTITIYN